MRKCKDRNTHIFNGGLSNLEAGSWENDGMMSLPGILSATLKLSASARTWCGKMCVFLTGTLPRVVENHNLSIFKSCPLRRQLLSKLASVLRVPKEQLEQFGADAFSLVFGSLGQFHFDPSNDYRLGYQWLNSSTTILPISDFSSHAQQEFRRLGFGGTHVLIGFLVYTRWIVGSCVERNPER